MVMYDQKPTKKVFLMRSYLILKNKINYKSSANVVYILTNSTYILRYQKERKSK